MESIQALPKAHRWLSIIKIFRTLPAGNTLYRQADLQKVRKLPLSKEVKTGRVVWQHMPQLHGADPSWGHKQTHLLKKAVCTKGAALAGRAPRTVQQDAGLTQLIRLSLSESSRMKVRLACIITPCFQTEAMPLEAVHFA